jgi:hypothetical protein
MTARTTICSRIAALPRIMSAPRLVSNMARGAPDPPRPPLVSSSLVRHIGAAAGGKERNR